MYFEKRGEIVQAHDYALPEDAISCAKKMVYEMYEKNVSRAHILLYLDGVWIEVNSFSDEEGLLDAWRRAYLIEDSHMLPTSFGPPKPVVAAGEPPTEPLSYAPPAEASRFEMAKWRYAFVSQLYIELRDESNPDIEPYIGWPSGFEHGRLNSLPDGAATHPVEMTYNFIIFWTKMVQKMMNEGVSFDEAALAGAQACHVLEVDKEEARTILRLIKIHLIKEWPYAQSLYDWYDNWMDTEFPSEAPPSPPGRPD